jgi:steroid delta-isomerase-like uncharacterized protein
VSEDIKGIVRRWFDEVWTGGSVASIDALMAPSCVVHGLGGEMRGPEAFKPFHSAYRNAFPDVKINVDHMVSEGDIVAARWSGIGTHRGDGLGFPATGRQVKLSGMTFVRIQNGKLVEGWNVFDQLGMLQQLDIVKLPG